VLVTVVPIDSAYSYIACSGRKVIACNIKICRSQRPCVLRRRSIEIVFSNPTGGVDVCLLWVLCVLSGRGLWDELIACPEKSYRLWYVAVCDLETW